MPLTMKTPEGMPPDLMAAAEETDAAIGQELAATVPPFEKPVAPKVMDALAKAIAAAAKVMGMDLMPEKYSEPVTELDPDLVRFLSMLEAAASDYGAPFPVALSAIKDDKALTAITAHLLTLAKDKGFKDFLDMPAEGETRGSEVTEEVMGEEEGPGGMTEGFDFAARMK